jgi:hypothetical protein
LSAGGGAESASEKFVSIHVHSWLIFSVLSVAEEFWGRPIRVILRLRQPARSKEQGNSFAGGQGADLHSPCTPGRERAATGTPPRLTFAVNKIRVNLRNLWLFLCLRVFVANLVFCPPCLKNDVQKRFILAHFCSIFVNFMSFSIKKVLKSAHFYPHFYAKNR